MSDSWLAAANVIEELVDVIFGFLEDSLVDSLEVEIRIDYLSEVVKVRSVESLVHEAKNAEVAAPEREKLHDILESILCQLVEVIFHWFANDCRLAIARFFQETPCRLKELKIFLPPLSFREISQGSSLFVFLQLLFFRLKRVAESEKLEAGGNKLWRFIFLPSWEIFAARVHLVCLLKLEIGVFSDPSKHKWSLFLLRQMEDRILIRVD